MANVPQRFRTFTKLRNVNVTRSVPDQRVDVAMEAARPRTFVGKISEMISQGPGPMPKAKKATGEENFSSPVVYET